MKERKRAEAIEEKEPSQRSHHHQTATARVPTHADADADQRAGRAADAPYARVLPHAFARSLASWPVRVSGRGYKRSASSSVRSQFVFFSSVESHSSTAAKKSLIRISVLPQEDLIPASIMVLKLVSVEIRVNNERAFRNASSSFNWLTSVNDSERFISYRYVT